MSAFRPPLSALSLALAAALAAAPAPMLAGPPALEAHKVTRPAPTDEQKKIRAARASYQLAQSAPAARLARSNDGLLLTGYSSSGGTIMVQVKNISGSPKSFDSSRLVGHAAGYEYPAGAASGYVIKPGETASIPVGFIGRGSGFVALTWSGSEVWITADGQLYPSVAEAQAVATEKQAYARAVQNANKLYQVERTK